MMVSIIYELSNTLEIISVKRNLIVHMILYIANPFYYFSYYSNFDSPESNLKESKMKLTTMVPYYATLVPTMKALHHTMRSCSFLGVWF